MKLLLPMESFTRSARALVFAKVDITILADFGARMLVTRRRGDDYFEMDTVRSFETARALRTSR